MVDSFVENLKESLERQIVTIIDFLFTDKKITEDEIISISKDTLKTIDTSKTKHELYGNFYKLIRLHPILKSYLHNTVKGLGISHGD